MFLFIYSRLYSDIGSVEVFVGGFSVELIIDSNGVRVVVEGVGIFCGGLGDGEVFGGFCVVFMWVVEVEI